MPKHLAEDELQRRYEDAVREAVIQMALKAGLLATVIIVGIAIVWGLL